MSRIKQWKSKRETLIENRAAIDFLAGGPGKHQYHYDIPDPPKPREKSAQTSEADVNDQIRAFAKHRAGLTLYRNNRGAIKLEDGSFLTYGVGPNGAADWIGYKTEIITPAMVGREIAVFVAIEAKRPGEPAREDQLKFLTAVTDAGGIAGVAHSSEELEKLVE